MKINVRIKIYANTNLFKPRSHNRIQEDKHDQSILEMCMIYIRIKLLHIPLRKETSELGLLKQLHIHALMVSEYELAIQLLTHGRCTFDHHHRVFYGIGKFQPLL